MRKIRDVLRLTFESQMSQRKIENTLGVSRRAVSDYISRASRLGITWPLAPSIDDFALEELLFPAFTHVQAKRKPTPDWNEIHQELKRKGATIEGLHIEYLTEYPDGMSYSNFCTQYREYKSTLRRSLRQTHIAGEKVFVDYAGPTVTIHNLKTGESKKAQIFVGVLGASKYTYADATWNQRKENWIASHARMFEYFGGVPVMVVCDNLKSGVIKPSRTEPIIQSAYKDMASHYGTAIFPARVYKPKDKANAEGGVLLIERWVLFRIRKHIFTSLAELNARIKELLVELNNRSFQKLTGSRMSLFTELDKPALKPLPSQPYEYREFHKVRSGYDYHIEIDKHFYSVPNALVRKTLEVILTSSTVEILHGSRRVATHARSYSEGKTTDSQHMSEAHRQYAKWDSAQEFEWALSVGAHTHAFLKILFEKSPHQDFSYRWANSIKSLFRNYGNERLEAACKLAIEIGATKSSNVSSILKSNLDQRASPTVSLNEASFEHDNIRGADYYH